MAKAEHEVTIDRPVSEVFAYLTDPDNLTEWQSGALECRRETEGATRVGSRFVETRKFLGKRMESTLEVTELEPDRRFNLRVAGGPVPFEVRHDLEPANGGTRIRVVIEGEPGGFFKVASPIVERQGRRELERDFGALKDILESRA